MTDGFWEPAGSTISGLSALQAIANGQRTINPYSVQQEENTRWVWMGDWDAGRPVAARTRVPDDGPGPINKGTLPKTRTAFAVDDARGLPYWWRDDPSKLQWAYEKASQAIGTEITSFSQFLSVWDKAVDAAEQSWALTGGQKPMTPWQAMELMKTDASDAYGDGSGGPVTTTSRTTTVNRLSDGSAWQVLKSAAQQALGRNPTHEELRSFAARANRIAVENPETVVTTSTRDGDGNTTSSSTRTPGATGDDYLTEAESKVDTEEAGAYQAATTYYSAMLSGLNSVV